MVLGLAVTPNRYPPIPLVGTSADAAQNRMTPTSAPAEVAVRLPASLSLHPLGGPACCPRRDARQRGLLERPGRGIEYGSGVSSRGSECEWGRASGTHCR